MNTINTTDDTILSFSPKDLVVHDNDIELSTIAFNDQ